MESVEERAIRYQPFFDGWSLGDAPKKLGKGTFGTVFEIYKDTQVAAMKMISIPPSEEFLGSYRSRYGSQPRVENALRRDYDRAVAEAKLMDRLNGTSNIVYFERIVKYERLDTYGWDVLIRMELLERLDHYLKRVDAEAQKGLFALFGGKAKARKETIRTAILMFDEILSALEECARAHVLHLDIKPGNIFYSAAPEHFKLGDFGEAKIYNYPREKVAKGYMVGTIDYMAPEVHAGMGADERADLYSLAMSVYWVLNNRKLPFAEGDETEPHRTVMQRANAIRFACVEEIPPIDDVPKQLMDLVLRCLSPDPDKRPMNASEARSDLRPLMRMV